MIMIHGCACDYKFIHLDTQQIDSGSENEGWLIQLLIANLTLAHIGDSEYSLDNRKEVLLRR